jgi:hypothetical protein
MNEYFKLEWHEWQGSINSQISRAVPSWLLYFLICRAQISTYKWCESASVELFTGGWERIFIKDPAGGRHSRSNGLFGLPLCLTGSGRIVLSPR